MYTVIQVCLQNVPLFFHLLSWASLLRSRKDYYDGQLKQNGAAIEASGDVMDPASNVASSNMYTFEKYLSWGSKLNSFGR